MKRITALLLACAFLFLCASCASQEKTEEPEESKTTENTAGQTSGSAAEDPENAISMYDLRVEMLASDPSLPEMLVASSADKFPEEQFKYLSDVDYEKVEGFFLAYAADGMAYEIAAVLMKKESDVSECENSLKDHVKGRVELYKNYAPEEVAKAREARVVKVGRCVALIMCDDKAAVETAMKRALAG